VLPSSAIVLSRKQRAKDFSSMTRTDDISFTIVLETLTFFFLTAAISHGGLTFSGQIPTHTIVLSLSGNNRLPCIFDQVTTLP